MAPRHQTMPRWPKTFVKKKDIPTNKVLLIVTERRYIFKVSKSQEFLNVGTLLQITAVIEGKHSHLPQSQHV